MKQDFIANGCVAVAKSRVTVQFWSNRLQPFAIIMPKEKKKRGRREQQKRQHEASSATLVSKKQRLDSAVATGYSGTVSAQKDGDVYYPDADVVELENDRVNRRTDIPFFGLLDEEEQAYYANANSNLELNDFESLEDRALFIEAVYRESQGKELKVACSQSCSRYLERLISVSNSAQLKSLWNKFRGHFLNLVQHRFASHCCETLFLNSAPIISQEVQSTSRRSDGDSPSMEQLFLEAIEELEDDVGYLLTERFASHAIRVLFVVLSGEPLETESTKSIIASRKKEHVDVTNSVSRARDLTFEQREIPKSFQDCFHKLKEKATSNLSTTYLRALATHPTGNPVLQLLLRIESAEYRRTKFQDDTGILYRLFPGDSFEEESENGKFALGLLYDPAGSRLLEAIVQHAPGKFFKRIYSNIFKKKLVSMTKHDLASYVAIQTLERIGKDELRDAINMISPELPTLVARDRVGVVHALVERCVVRRLNTKSLASRIKSAYGDDYKSILPKMLHLDAEYSADSTRLVQADSKSRVSENKAGSIDPHGALLAQTMTRSPGFEDIIQAAILATPKSLLILLAKDPVASRVLQAALTSHESSLEFRRQLIPKFYGILGDLSVHGSGSHVVDCLWTAANGLHYMKEQLAQELSINEMTLRESTFGKIIWRNWKMDLYRRRKVQWIAEAKGLSEKDTANGKTTRESKINLARQRFVTKHGR